MTVVSLRFGMMSWLWFYYDLGCRSGCGFAAVWTSVLTGCGFDAVWDTVLAVVLSLFAVILYSSLLISPFFLSFVSLGHVCVVPSYRLTIVSFSEYMVECGQALHI